MFNLLSKTSFLALAVTFTVPVACIGQQQISPNPNPSGNFIYLPASEAYNNSVFFENHGLINVDSIDTPFRNQSTISNHFSFALGGFMEDAFFTNQRTGEVFSEGSWISTGHLRNAGQFHLNRQSDSREGFPQSVVEIRNLLTNDEFNGIFSIAEGGTLHNRGTVSNLGLLRNGGIFFSADVGGTIVNDGELNNRGDFVNVGDVRNNSSGRFLNFLNVQDRGNTTNHGEINNSGIYNVGSTGMLQNTGEINNSGSFNPNGMVQNSGKFINERFTNFQGFFSEDGGNYDGDGLTNIGGSFQNDGEFSNGGILELGSTGTFTNNSSFSNSVFSVENNFEFDDEFEDFFETVEVSGFIVNCGDFINNGTIQNDGKFNNCGELTNNGVFDSTQGEFLNSGVLRGDGEFRGIITNTGSLVADAMFGALELNEVDLREEGLLAVELGGMGFSNSGLFEVDSSFLVLDGTFRPIVNDDLVAEIGDTYTFLTADGVDLASRFDLIDHSLARQYRFDVEASGTSLTLRVVDIVSVPEPAATTLLGIASVFLMVRRRRVCQKQ